MLPSEQQLAAEFGVSQGTVRKALDSLTADNLLFRCQGRGTFVAEPDEGRNRFQFFKIAADDGTRAEPASTPTSLTRCRANQQVRSKLCLRAHSSVWRIDRTRLLEGRSVISETLFVPVSRFAGLDRIKPTPNDLYSLYALKFGITVARAVERLKAVAASKADVERLGCAPGTPLLEIDRVAYSLNGEPMEWRLSRCLTQGFHYLSDVK
jgi:GntR family transcriptional regulator